MCYRLGIKLGVRNMGKEDQTPQNAKADQIEPLAERIAALQERAASCCGKQTLTSAEMKAFMDDQWAEGEDEDR